MQTNLTNPSNIFVEGEIDLVKHKEKILKILKEKNIKVQDAQDMIDAMLTHSTLEKESNKKIKPLANNILQFQKDLMLHEIDIITAGKAMLIFADPTYDATF